MTSSLALQLKRLKTPQSNLYDQNKRKASILFTAQEAAHYPSETFYQIAIAGFSELLEVNHDFKKFESRLFGEQTQDFQRTMQTKSVNNELDIIIEKFLLTLSPYLQKQAALKALEWLIHRFLVHEMDVNSLMMCIFPYYENIIFIRILQLIKINNSDSWNWLQNYQNKNRPIPKETVFHQWNSSVWFRNFLSKYFDKMVATCSHSDQHMQLAASLLISSQIGGLGRLQQITEGHMLSIVMNMTFCLASKQNDTVCGMLLVIGQLAILTHLSSEFTNEVINIIIKIVNPDVIEHSAISLLTLFYHQDTAKLLPDMVLALENNRPLLVQITRFSNIKPVSPLMAPFVKGLIISILRSEEFSAKEKSRLDNVIALICEMPAPPSESTKIIKAFLQALFSCYNELEKLEKSVNPVQIIKTLESSHPDGFDRAFISLYNSPMSKKKLKESQFKFQVLNEYKESWIVVSNHDKDISIVKEAKPISVQDQWKLCLKADKLSPESVTFLREQCASIDLPKKLESIPFWDLAGKSEYSTSLRTLVKVLRIFVRHHVSNTAPPNNLILQAIFKDILGSSKAQIYFLSMILSWNLDLENVDIDRGLKLWSFGILEALLTSNKNNDGSLSWVVDTKEPLFASLITSICEGDYLCKGAFRVLEAMRNLVGGNLCPNSLSSFINGLLQESDKIYFHVSYLPSTVASLLSEKKLNWKTLYNWFICVTDADVPMHIKASILYTLSDVMDSRILPDLMPLANTLMDKLQSLKKNEILNVDSSTCLYYILRRFASNTDFLELAGGWDMFRRSLLMSERILQVNGQLMSPQDLMANFKLLQGLLTSERQIEILEILLVRIKHTDQFPAARKLTKELRTLELDASIFLKLWNKYNLLSTAKSVMELRSKRLKLQKDSTVDHDLDIWKKLQLSIEVISVMSELKKPWLLVGALCDHLQVLMKLNPLIIETLQQQILTVCHHLLQLSSEELEEQDFIDNCKLNVALIVQCIRTSINPDIHRRALLILSLASKYFPDQVLHNIMAIFTFMGTSLFRRDDAYSFQIIHLTISSIVPILIQTEQSEPNLLLKKLSQVTQVFVDALPDVAEHRRLPLFIQLATTLGVSQYLWLVMVLIADAYVAGGPPPHVEDEVVSDARRLPKNILFAISLYSEFSVVDQLKASFEVLRFIIDLPDNKDASKLKSSNFSGLVINIETRASRQLRQLKYTCLGLLVHLLSSEKFVGQVYQNSQTCTEDEIKELQIVYLQLLETSLQYLKVALEQEKLQKDNPSGSKFWSALQRKLMDLVDAINSLLPPPLLIKVLSGLFVSNSSEIRCRAVEILSSKLQPDVKFFEDHSIPALSGFISPLMEASKNIDEPEVNRQTSLFTLQLLMRILAPHIDTDGILPILELASSLIKCRDPSIKVLTQAALVVAEAVHILKIHSLPYWTELVPSFLSILKDSLKSDSPVNQDNLIISSTLALHRMVENLPRLLSKKNLSSLLMTSCQLICKQEQEGFKESRLATKLTSTLGQLVRSVEMRIIVPVFIKTYHKLSAVSIESLPSLMNVMESLLGFIKPTDLSAFKDSLTNLFLSTFDFRSLMLDHSIETTKHVESCIVTTLSRFMLKLNEDENYRIFTTILKSALNSIGENPHKLVTFFRFATHHAGNLKVLFIKAKLAKYLLEHAAQILDRNNNRFQSDTIFGSGEEAETNASELLITILESLDKIFLYDSLQFLNEENFNIIIQPLMNQIGNTLGSQDEYMKRICDHLKPCVIRFTKALRDEFLWKEVNRQVLLHIRIENESKVILAGLEIFEGLIDSLGEEYLQPLLPDTIPNITEILESIDEEVEEKSKRVFNKMEVLTGDSLRAYLDT